MGLATRRLLSFRENAAQDVHFQLADTRAPVKTTQTRHQVARLGGIEEANIHQGSFQVSVEQLQLVGGHRLRIQHRRGFHLAHLGRLPLHRQPSHAHLIGQNLYGSRQIQRAEVGI